MSIYQSKLGNAVVARQLIYIVNAHNRRLTILVPEIIIIITVVIIICWQN